MFSLQQVQDFSIIDLIKAGSYSSVYTSQDKKGHSYAIKILENEPEKPKKTLSIFRSSKPFKEGKILALLQKIQGIPKLYFYGKNPDINANMIVTELLGKDLGVLYAEKKEFSLDFICMLAMKLLHILEEIHKKNVIHRDLKPDNILLHRENPDEFYLTDFGLSKIDKKKKAKKYKKPQFVGNMKYASINSHFGCKITKKDDLESLGYVISNFILGYLPWEKINCDDLNEKIERIGKRKQHFLGNDLSYLPKRMAQYFEYLQNVKPLDPIDYGFLKGLFVGILNDSKIEEKIDLNATAENKSSIIGKDLTSDLEILTKNNMIEGMFLIIFKGFFRF